MRHAITTLLMVILALAFVSTVHAKAQDMPPMCGDNKINQDNEECDGRKGVPKGYLCNEDCLLEQDPVKTLRDCKRAVRDGTLTGSINGEGEATVKNNGDKQYDITLVAYTMNAKKIKYHTYFDSLTQQVAPPKTAFFSVDLPECAYHVALVCGEAITDKPPRYGAKIIDVAFGNTDVSCVQN